MAQLSLALKLGPWAAILLLLGIASYQSTQIHRWHVQNDKNVAGREADRARYEQAQRDASAQNHAQVAVKEAQSRKVSDDERQAYLRDLAQLRADDQRLRAQVAAASGSARPAPSPSAPAPASGADANGLHLSADDHLQAAEIELRLMHLQNWVEQQLAIDPNKP